MEFNPARSWAVTYNQMWNLSMTNPINRMQNNRGSANTIFGNWTQNNSGYKPSGRRPKSDYCWGFNKGLKCKFGRNCRFIERCSYCDSSAHGVIDCPKLDKKDKDQHRQGKQGKFNSSRKEGRTSGSKTE